MKVFNGSPKGTGSDGHAEGEGPDPLIAKTVRALDRLDRTDRPSPHGTADLILLAHLRAIGHEAVADAFNRAASRCGELWYA